MARPRDPQTHCSTAEAAQALGLAVRSVQLMVDRGELLAWKTPGGHRRIWRHSLEAVLAARDSAAGSPPGADSVAPLQTPDAPAPRIVLIEDSVHFQNLVSLLIRQCLPQADLHVADDGITGLALTGRLKPQLLIVDILLPGIDGATLVTRLRSHPEFAGMTLVIITSLTETEREPYALALKGLPVVHKPRLVAELPGLLAPWGSGAHRPHEDGPSR